MRPEAHPFRGPDWPTRIETAIVDDGLFDDAVLERAKALGWTRKEPVGQGEIP